VPFSVANKAGFVLALLLAVLDVGSVLNPTPEGEVGPPLAILAVGALLGLITIVAVAFGWSRGSRGAVRAAAAARILSALLALPAFAVAEVPPVLKALAGAFVLATILAVALMLKPTRGSASTR
jgi:hypothetical protein